MVSDKLKKKIIQVVGDGPITDEFLRDVDLEINRNPVTGMPDGRQLSNDLEGIVSRSRRRGEYDPANNKTYIAIIDIDLFGDFNKDYGQETGDKVLREVNTIISQTLRENDTVENRHNNYHLHGEEMVAIYQCSNYTDAEKVAQRLREEIKQKSKDNVGLEVTISVGLTEYNPTAEEYETAQARADRYMQVAKKEGRNRVYTGDIDPLYEFKEKYLYRPGFSEVAAKYIAESVKGAKGFVGKTLTQIYTAAQKIKKKQ